MGSKPIDRVPRKVWLAGALVVVVGVLLFAQDSTVLVPSLESYSVIDRRTVAARVYVAPCSWTRVTEVVETSADVRVTVKTWPCPIPLAGTAELVARDLTVSLATDLASRVVLDANGQAVPPAK